MVVVGLLVSVGTAVGQQRVTFEASISAAQITLGDYVKVSFALTDVNPVSFTPPSFSQFEIIGRETSPSFSFGSGGIKRTVSYIFYIRPKKAGQYTIGSATIKANNRTYKTKSLKLEVLKPGAPGTPEALLKSIQSGEDIFLVAQVSNTNPHLGEQIILDYTLYVKLETERRYQIFDRYNILNKPKFPGFFFKYIQQYNSNVQTETVEGTVYRTRIIRRMALFPQKTGLLTVPSLYIKVRIPMTGQRRSLGQNILSDEVALNTRSLPTFDRPESFSGAIGEYRLFTEIKPSQLSTDDAFTLVMFIRGKGDVKLIQPPDPTPFLPDGFEVYEPKIDERTSEEGSHIGGLKRFEYQVLPRQVGSFEFQPNFTYFSPDSSRYITVFGDSVRMQIRQGQQPLTTTIDTTDFLSLDAQKTIQPIRTASSLARNPILFMGSIPFWGLVILPFGMLGLAFWFRQRQQRYSNQDFVLLKRQKANQEAQRRLTTAKTHLDNGAYRSFYDEIIQAIWKYNSDKFNIPLSQLSQATIKEHLSATQLEETQTKRLLQLLDTCELALFGGDDQASAAASVYQDTHSILAAIEEVLAARN